MEVKLDNLLGIRALYNEAKETDATREILAKIDAIILTLVSGIATKPKDQQNG